ncbi:UDP-3-O-acyl-N-acetylglucosamine deacetylase [Magnetovibrio blakemorei]|uniref:UDP-3-O-acyl-N-acetylglucosamine deacetylase n=1 Tax=Magnetovibrio blakemorei TaxID=28181 RepID=UPI000A7978CE|nr:UDP-3-O-acyl-N-acetylglucosamine deacetylase [Magnetovibrio blakemorei]
MIKQQTLKSAISCTGVGLHSGEKISMTLLPADVDAGIVFRRTDIAGGGAVIPAAFDQVCDSRLCTTIGSEKGKTIATIEHLMAALAGSGIDNAVIEVGGPEVPVMDGSAAPFMFLIDCAGVAEQDAPRKAVRVLKPVFIEDGDKLASLVPADGFSIEFNIEFDNAIIGTQSMSVDLTDGVFKNEIARARTFGFLHEAEALWAAGLAKGASLDNAVVVSGDRILNEDGLRFDDECVRHKILDAVGDLYLAGATLVGHYTGTRASHALNNALLRELFSDPANFELVDMNAPVSRLGATGSSWAKESVAASPATA